MKAAKEIKNSIQAQEDKELVAILKDENSPSRAKESAFNKLYSRHQKNLTHYFKLRVKDADTAEDLKMIAFEKAYSNISSYDDKFAFTTWLYNIAKNSYIDQMRKDKDNELNVTMGEYDGNGDTAPFQIKSGTLDPEQELLREEKIKRIHNAIDSLESELVRELMTERFINDLSFEQIAEKMGIENNSTLRVNILRGKEIIKDALADLNPYA